MKKIIEKLIGRLEEKFKYNSEQAEIYRDGSDKDAYFREKKDLYMDRANTYGEVMRIVNRLAEEYKGGWIACSERLPEKEVDVLVCFSNDMDCVIAYRTKMMNTNLKEVWVNSSTAHIISSNIIAWQPLPAPFKKGE